MKLNRNDILALIVLAMGLLVFCFGQTPGIREGGVYVAATGLLGCVMSFLVGGND